MATLEFKLFGALFLFALFSGDALAKDWHGLVPLTSTREDVIRTFNHCADENPSCEFGIQDASIHIEFSGSSTGELHDCATRLPTDTVLLIEVTPTKALKFKELALNKRLFKPFNLEPPMSRKYRGFINDYEGLVLRTYEGKVVQLDYIARADVRHLCEGYYKEPESFVQEPFLSHVPVIALNCPDGEFHAGDELNFSANISGTPRISFLWTVSAGRIIDGQGTRHIRLNTTGLQGKIVKVNVSLGRVASSCQLRISQ